MPNEMPVGELRDLLVLDEETGKLFWRPRSARHFLATGNLGPASKAARWNGQFAGKEAFTASHDRGYRVGAIWGRNYLAHRVAWALFYGEWPTSEIDHINHNSADNRIANLRLVSHSQNGRNMSRRSDNTSGQTGVHWLESRQKWLAYIRHDGGFVNLGYFTDFDRAKSARKNAERRYGYHENHGSDLKAAA